MDEWNSSFNGNTLKLSLKKANQKNEVVGVNSFKLEPNTVDVPLLESSVKSIIYEPKDSGKKSKNDQPQLIEMKKEKNLKVQSFLRNLGIRIMKAFQIKGS